MIWTRLSEPGPLFSLVCRKLTESSFVLYWVLKLFLEPISFCAVSLWYLHSFFFQNAYDIDELKKPLHTIPHISLREAAPHSKTSTGPKRDSLPKCAHQKQSTSAVTNVPDFKEYVSQIIWDADNDLQSLPADTIHFYCLEGQCSLAGSLSSLDSISGDEDLNYDCQQEWGSKFDKLKELYKVSNEHL